MIKSAVAVAVVLLSSLAQAGAQDTPNPSNPITEIDGVKIGMTVDQLPAKVDRKKIARYQWLGAAYEWSDCQTDNSRCLQILFDGMGKQRKVYVVVLQDEDFGKFDPNAIRDTAQALIKRYGQPKFFSSGLEAQWLQWGGDVDLAEKHFTHRDLILNPPDVEREVRDMSRLRGLQYVQIRKCQWGIYYFSCASTMLVDMETALRVFRASKQSRVKSIPESRQDRRTRP